MAVTSLTAPKLAPMIADQGKANLSATKTVLAGSKSSWGLATSVTLLGLASQKSGPTAYSAQARLQASGVKLSDDQKKKLAEQNQTAQQIGDMVKSSKDDRKALAKQKIEQLKKRLQQLRMSGGDPKLIARQAAQLARELKQAVQEYGAASATATAVPANANVPQANANADATSANAAGDGAAAAETAAVPADGTTATAVPDTPPESPEASVGVTGDEPQANLPADGGTRPDEGRVRALLDHVAEKAAGAGAARAEREVINDIKTLAKQIKALFEQSKRKAEQEKGSDPDLNQDGKAVGEATREIDKVVQDLEKSLNGSGSDPAGAANLASLGDTADPVGQLVSVLA
jgi:hypothetical protein